MHRGRQRLPVVCLAVFLAPLALVKLTAMWSELGGPRNADASAGAEAPPVAAVAAPAPSPCPPGAQRAGLHAAQLRRLNWGLSPFTEQPKPTPLAKPAAAPVVKVVFAPMIRSIMASQRGKFAVIDGSVRGVGDMLPQSDWAITAIDAVERTVTFHNSVTDETVTLGVNGDERN